MEKEMTFQDKILLVCYDKDLSVHYYIDGSEIPFSWVAGKYIKGIKFVFEIENLNAISKKMQDEKQRE